MISFGIPPHTIAWLIWHRSRLGFGTRIHPFFRDVWMATSLSNHHSFDQALAHARISCRNGSLRMRTWTHGPWNISIHGIPVKREHTGGDHVRIRCEHTKNTRAASTLIEREVMSIEVCSTVSTSLREPRPDPKQTKTGSSKEHAIALAFRCRKYRESGTWNEEAVSGRIHKPIKAGSADSRCSPAPLMAATRHGAARHGAAVKRSNAGVSDSVQDSWGRKGGGRCVGTGAGSKKSSIFGKVRSCGK